MTTKFDVVELREALIDIVTTSAGVAESPGGSPSNDTVADSDRQLSRTVALVARVVADERGCALNAGFLAHEVVLHTVGSPDRPATAA